MKRHIYTVIVLAAFLSPTGLMASEPYRITAWGYNYYEQCNVPQPNYDFNDCNSIAGGYYHSLGLKNDSSIVAWGRNNAGQCSVPAPNTNFIAVAAGAWHSLGLKSNGSIIAWGNNSYGQCDVPEPNAGFVAVAAGTYHSLGLKADGTIVAWGGDSYGQCDVPVPNSDFVAVAAGYYHSLGLKSDGSIVAWGYNYYGQCDVPAPNISFKAIAAGSEHSLGLKQGGSIVAWGNNNYNQCDVPEPNVGFKAIAAGSGHSLGLKQSGSIVAWGRNTYGQCNVPSPNADFACIAAGWFHSLGITAPASGEYTITGEVNLDVVYQQLDGFGGAAVYECPSLTTHTKKEEIYDLLFKELGIEILRIRNTYGYSTDPGNNELLGTAEVVVEARKPQRSPNLKIELVPWSCPAYLKSNGSESGGGTLAKDGLGNFRYDDYAQWWYDSLVEFAAHGVEPDFISIQNEPTIETSYDSCRFYPNDGWDPSVAAYNVAFEKVWQKLHAEMGSSMPEMWGPESMGLMDMSWYIPEFNDVSHVAGFSHHLYFNDYGGSSYDEPDSLIGAMTNAYANYGYKPLHMTEYVRLNTIPNFDMGLKFAWHIYNSLYYLHSKSYFNWTLFRAYGSGGIVTLDSSSTYIIRPQYWFLKAYTHFTGKDWSLLGTSVSGADYDNIRMSAFKDPNNHQLTVVILNKSGSNESLELTLNGFSPDNSEVYRSGQTENWVYLGTFSNPVLLPPQSITTIHLTRTLDFSNCSEVQDNGYGLPSDLDGDCYVNYEDLKIITDNWLRTDCTAPDNCEGADFKPADGVVDLFDFSDFAMQWLWCNDPEGTGCVNNW